MSDEDSRTLEGARGLCAEAGLPPPLALDRLAGGKNNRVHRVTTDGGPDVILKSYFHDPRDTRDRLGAEWGFLTRAWDRGVRTVPQPLACDRAAHLGLYTLVPGNKLAPGEVSARHLDAALDFVLALNAEPRDAGKSPPASEACFSVAQHIETVERRVARLANLDPDAPLRAEAEAFVRERLSPAWERARAGLLALPGDAHSVLPASRQIVSPSDFGFHNALADSDGVLRFIDFEYAGGDDPAKLASDLFCCPEIPAPSALHGRFVDGLVAGLALDASDVVRARALLPAYRVKWACIILNHFLPTGAARRGFADQAADEARCAGQLARARASLDAMDNTLPTP